MQNAPEDEVTFRPFKKRKFIRQRPSEHEDHVQSQGNDSVGADLSSNTADETAGSAVGPAVVPARSRALKPARPGVAFSNRASTSRNTRGDSEAIESQSLVMMAPPGRRAVQAASRFVAGTGQIAGRDDQHMTAFVESKLAERESPPSDSETSSRSADEMSSPESRTRATTNPSSSVSEHHGVSMMGTHMVQEVQVGYPSGDSARRNPPGSRKPRPPKPRIGRNGKLLPPRKPRGYRDEEDKTRDTLVERILSEHRPEGMYDTTATTITGADGPKGQDVDADRHLAEEFEREYKLNVKERKAKRAAPAAKTAKPKPKPKSGPKLGGSKNDRKKRYLAQRKPAPG